MRKNKGITLIALVVTIIVLLILAGVSITMVAGDNGIVTKAKKSAEETDKAGKIEEIALELSNLSMDNMGEISEDELEDVLLSHGTLSDEEDLLDKTLTTEDGIKIKVIEIYDGTLTSVPKSITLDASNISVSVGSERTLTATLTNLSEDIIWTVADESVAKICFKCNDC